LITPPPPSPLFPYTTLFRSHVRFADAAAGRPHQVELAPQRPPHLLVGKRDGFRAADAPGVERAARGEPLVAGVHAAGADVLTREDRKSTRLNSSHDQISYAV